MKLKITHRITKEANEIPLETFRDYCENRGWTYDDAKVVLNRPGIHYENRYFSVIEELTKKADNPKGTSNNERKTEKTADTGSN